MTISKILCPTDLSDEGNAARELAVALAKRHGASLFLFHAVVTYDHEFRQLGPLLQDFLDKLESEATETLEKRARAIGKEGTEVSFGVVQAATAYGAIMERVSSLEPDCIVMGTHGRRGMGRWFLGSVAEKVVRHAPCTVVTVRPSEGDGAKDLKRVIVPVDFSENSARAVGAARTFVGHDGTLILLHVVLNPAFKGLHPSEYIRLFSVDPSLPDRVRDRMVEWAEGQSFETDVREGDDVAASILSAVRDHGADAVVMGTRGHTGLDHLVMGSVAEKVVRSSDVPVVTVK